MYSYDGESRLTKVVKNGATQVDCVYDGNGMRVKKVEGGKTTYYIYSGANPLLEYSPTDGSYLYRIYAGKKAVAEEKSGVVKFYHKDHLGSTRVVTNAAGMKIAEYKFAPYGEKEVSTGDGTEYGFTDKADDASTGLKYFGARFYDAETGRFLTIDPQSGSFKLERPQTQNRYSYCWNNPIKLIDPNGQEPIYLSSNYSVVSNITGPGYTSMTTAHSVTVLNPDGTRTSTHTRTTVTTFEKSEKGAIAACQYNADLGNKENQNRGAVLTTLGAGAAQIGGRVATLIGKALELIGIVDLFSSKAEVTEPFHAGDKAIETITNTRTYMPDGREVNKIREETLERVDSQGTSDESDDTTTTLSDTVG